MEACPPGASFGTVACTSALAPAWVAVGASTPEALLSPEIGGLAPGVLYRWRARVLHAPPTGPLPAQPPHSPWRRLGAQAVEADVRTAAAPACSNGLDDDGDGLIDHPADPGCTSAADLSEKDGRLFCDDGLDNDGDGWTDYSITPSLRDPGCRDPSWLRENPQCQDGLNNDGQIGIDFDGGASLNGGIPVDVPDPQCNAAWKNKESASSCGLGFELAPILLTLAALRRRARGRAPAR
jgi:hypothetical protein